MDSVQFWLRPVCRWAIYGFASGSRTWLSVQPKAGRRAPGDVWLEPESAEPPVAAVCSVQREENGTTDLRGWGRLEPQFAVFSQRRGKQKGSDE